MIQELHSDREYERYPQNSNSGIVVSKTRPGTDPESAKAKHCLYYSMKGCSQCSGLMNPSFTHLQ